MADDSNNVVPVKRRQKVHRLSSTNNLALACVLAFVLMMSSVTVVMPLAAAQNAPSGGTSQGEGEKDKKFELVEASISDIQHANLYSAVDRTHALHP